MENLCETADFTGWTVDGGYAEGMTAFAEAAALPIPEAYGDAEAAPLLCAGLIGYRAWRMACEAAGEVAALGLYGFGAAAHLLAPAGDRPRPEGLRLHQARRRGGHGLRPWARLRLGGRL